MGVGERDEVRGDMGCETDQWRRGRKSRIKFTVKVSLRERGGTSGQNVREHKREG